MVEFDTVCHPACVIPRKIIILPLCVSGMRWYDLIYGF